MKKIMVFLLSVLILAGAVMPATANNVTATTACTTTADSIVRGDTVTVTVSLSNCANLKSIALTPTYDSDVFELVSGEWLLKDAMLSSFDTEKGNAVIAYSAETDANGDIFKFILKVKDSAPFGETSLKADPVVKNGSVSIECQATEKTVTVNCSHKFDSNWRYDANQHWKECLVNDCDEKSEAANHTYDNDCDTTCNVCGYKRTITHSYSEVWSHDDTNHWYECTVCGDKKDTAPHSGGTATCNEKAICSFCDTPYGDFADHNYVEKAEEQYLKSAATCNAPAVYYKSCSVCGAKSTETFEYGDKNPDNHTGGTYLKNQQEATCKYEGYTGDTYCKGCDVKISDGKAIAKTPHVVTEWTVTKEATAEESGTKTGKCTVCGEEIVAETGKLISKVEGDSAKVEAVGDTALYENIILKTDKISDKLSDTDKADMQAKIEALKLAVENIKMAEIFDISLFLRDTDASGNPIQDLKYEPNGKIRITMEVPEAIFKNFKNVKLLHFLDDGTVEAVDYTLDGSKAVFETESLSYFAFAGTPIVTETGSITDNGTKNENNGQSTSPKTGDSSNPIVWIAVLLVSALTVGTVSVYSRKKNCRACKK